MKNNKGFTLIELMIVIAIIAIIAAIAIPNLMASRIRANEATAISGIKQIATAQVTFQAGRQGRDDENTNGGPTGFCDNYMNLAFGRPVGDSTGKLALISDVIANAAIDLTNGGGATDTVSNAGLADAPAAYQGYRFSSDVASAAASVAPDGSPVPAVEGNVDYSTDFACYTVPQLGGTSGNNAYWVGQQGTVYIAGIVTNTPAAAYAAGDTPQSQDVIDDETWMTL